MPECLRTEATGNNARQSPDEGRGHLHAPTFSAATSQLKPHRGRNSLSIIKPRSESDLHNGVGKSGSAHARELRGVTGRPNKISAASVCPERVREIYKVMQTFRKATFACRWGNSGTPLSGQRSILEVAPIHQNLPYSGTHEGMSRLSTWVTRHGGVTLTMREAAAIAHCEYRYFSRLFRRHFGQSFRQWRYTMRMARSVQALSSGHSVSDTLTQAGYRDRRAFERALIRFTGVTPGQLRENSPVAKNR
jgi:AraC-like DNA-binding protein